MSPEMTHEVTDVLRAWNAGEAGSEARLMELIYDELRRLASNYLRKERHGHTLQPTALVHEAYMRLADIDDLSWQNRDQFYAIAAKTMRRILVEYARGHNRLKRGGGNVAKVPLESAGSLSSQQAAEVVAVDEALRDFAKLDPEKAAIVELRFFGGLSIGETAEVMGCSTATITRQWRVAKAWLRTELAATGAPVDSAEWAELT